MNKIITGICLLALPLLSFGQSIVRGPYLQLRNQNSIQVRYNTNTAVQTHVKYGLSPSNLNYIITSTDYKLRHIAQISGLSHSTKYYYAVYNGNTKLQGDADNYFITTQPTGSQEKMRFWVTGDCGTGNTTQINTKNQFLNFVGNNYIDGWLLLGDNAYDHGTESEYTGKFFNIYQNDRIMKQTTIYPAPGNHDYSITPTARNYNDHNVEYYNIFAPVLNAEMGGVASSHKEYYSYNVGNIHFVSLDSYGKETPNNYVMSDTISPQIVWLKQDLAANTQKWTVVYWHHSPYTMGTHNSDNELDLVAIRQKLVPIIERYNVDLVLTAHSHNYERSKLIKGHLGNEASFSSALHVVDGSSGYYDGTSNSCPYQKKSNGSIKGTVYMVSGSAGNELYEQPSFPHAALPHVEASEGGSLLIEVEGDRLDMKMVSESGVIRDKFTMVKDMNQTRTVNVPLNSQSFEVKSPYNEPSVWVSNPNVVSSFVIQHPVKGMAFKVEDTKNCFKDTLIINTFDPCLNSQIIDCVVEPTSNINLKTATKITGSSTLSISTNVIFDAKRFVELLPGFETKSGTNFSAKIGGCN